MRIQSVKELSMLVVLPTGLVHALKGDRKGYWTVWVSGNWRLTFKFEGEDAVLVDYH